MARKLQTIIADSVDMIKSGEYDAAFVSGLVTKTVVAEQRGKKLLAEVLPIIVGYTKTVRDTEQLNVLFSGLMPSNKAYAKLFFAAFLPFEYGSHDPADKRTKSYGKVNKKVMTADKMQAQDTDWNKFLSVNKEGEIDTKAGYFGGDYWLWAEKNVQVKGQPNWVEMFDSAMDNLTSDDKGGYDVGRVLSHIISTKGIDTANLLELLAQNPDVDVEDEVKKGEV